MTIIEMAKVTSKGQVTIPISVRKILHLDRGSSVAFGLSKQGVVLLRCKVTTEAPYTTAEWEKIEKLAAAKGKICKTAKEAIKHLGSL